MHYNTLTKATSGAHKVVKLGISEVHQRIANPSDQHCSMYRADYDCSTSPGDVYHDPHVYTNFVQIPDKRRSRKIGRHLRAPELACVKVVLTTVLSYQSALTELAQ